MSTVFPGFGGVSVFPEVSMVFSGVPVTFGVSSGDTPMLESLCEDTPVCC